MVCPRSGRTDRSVRLKSRNPVCVELIGLSTVPDHQLPIRRNIKTEIVEHLLCSAGGICRQPHTSLARHDAVSGEPDCPVRLESLDRGDKPANQLFVVMRILTSGRDGLTRMPEMGLQRLCPRHRLGHDIASPQVNEFESTQLGAQQVHSRPAGLDAAAARPLLSSGSVSAMMLPPKTAVGSLAGRKRRSNESFVDLSITWSGYTPVVGVPIQSLTIEVGGWVASNPRRLQQTAQQGTSRAGRRADQV